jgi:glycosyltransferase involved in cell wall biosynthesis
LTEYIFKHGIVPKIPLPPSEKPHIIVVIPCFNEPDLLRSLQSLYDCTPPRCAVEVLVVVNHPQGASSAVCRQNGQSLHDGRLWAQYHSRPRLSWHFLDVPDVPVKDAGVGFARKTGMDEAIFRFNLLDAEDGVMAGFDADSICDANYLTELERVFDPPEVNGASIYFEHPVSGDDFPPAIYEGIVLYELHLRYLNQAMRYSGFPYAFHTVGSSFAVRASAYVKQGGMNKRKAGEDFHFLHKIIPLGHYKEINTTRVMPSPRISDRVPFGTGAGISRWMQDGHPALFTYPPESFECLKAFFELMHGFYASSTEKIRNLCEKLPISMLDYLNRSEYLNRIANIQHNSASQASFEKHFWAWFGGLQVIKYLNHSCNGYFEKQPANKAAAEWMTRITGQSISCSAKELLFLFRDWERGGLSKI